MLSLTNELLELSLLPQEGERESRWEYSIYLRKIRPASLTCRRLREVLSPHIYRHIVFFQYSIVRYAALLDLTPTYGQFITEFSFCAPAEPSDFYHLMKIVAARFKDLAHLKLLTLNIQGSPDSLRWMSTMTRKQDLKHWGDFWCALPAVCQLTVRGGEWNFLCRGFAVANHPSVRTIGFHDTLPIEMRLKDALLFNRAFTSLTCISFPGSFCPNEEWIATAFAGCRLESITLGSETHYCNEPCLWDEGVSRLLSLSSSSLSSLTIRSTMALNLASEHTILPCLSTLKFQGIHFNDDEEKLEDLLQGFLKSPLQHLSLDNCMGVPRSLVSWFDPTKQNWPGLKSLSLLGLCVESDPQIALEEFDEEEIALMDDGAADGVCWDFRSRCQLEDFCNVRGISLDPLGWYEFEGYGA